MPLADDIKNNFLEVLNFAAADAAQNLSNVISKSVQIEVEGITESLIKEGNITVSEKQSLININLSDANLNGLYIITDNKLAWTIASGMAGSSDPLPEEISLDENQQNAISEAISQTLTALSTKFTSIKNEFSLTTNGTNYQALNPEDAASLAAPEGCPQDLSTLKLKVKIDDIETSVNLELNTELANFLAAELSGSLAGAAADGDSAFEAGKVSGVNFANISNSFDPSDDGEDKNLGLLMDIRMGLIVELGRSEMPLKDILKLSKGSVIELDRLSGEPVDLFINNKLIARGEVVVIDDNFGLRITQLAGKLNIAEDIGLIANEA